ncbi:hypothetical protein [Variovorax sp. Varisp36]|uniref:hypothetical protein n=1 Tax=Variovorax sp. Varisp36 TaxID=3243031 RepID=UPI0039A61829
MSATLYYNGIRINVPTNELAEALRQISSLSGAVLQRPTLSGTVVLHPAPPPSGALDTEGQQSIDSLDTSTEKRVDTDIALAFLKTIAEYRLSGGAPINAVMAVLGAAHAKGVGSKTVIVNKVLDRLGFAIPDVYTNDRDSLGMRNWRPGPRFDEAVRMLSPSRDEEEDDL